jgi:hypothetical protein
MIIGGTCYYGARPYTGALGHAGPLRDFRRGRNTTDERPRIPNRRSASWALSAIVVLICMAPRSGRSCRHPYDNLIQGMSVVYEKENQESR